MFILSTTPNNIPDLELQRKIMFKSKKYRTKQQQLVYGLVSGGMDFYYLSACSLYIHYTVCNIESA